MMNKWRTKTPLSDDNRQETGKKFLLIIIKHNQQK